MPTLPTVEDIRKLLKPSIWQIVSQWVKAWWKRNVVDDYPYNDEM